MKMLQKDYLINHATGFLHCQWFPDYMDVCLEGLNSLLFILVKVRRVKAVTVEKCK